MCIILISNAKLCGMHMHVCIHACMCDTIVLHKKIPINNLCVNPAKSKFMYFSLGSQSSFDLIPPFNLGDKAIERVYSYKYLNWTYMYLFLHSLMVSTHHPKLITSKAKLMPTAPNLPSHSNPSTL